METIMTEITVIKDDKISALIARDEKSKFYASVTEASYCRLAAVIWAKRRNFDIAPALVYFGWYASRKAEA
jgi:hypothetical protein